jgi:hypothetical protein
MSEPRNRRDHRGDNQPPPLAPPTLEGAPEDVSAGARDHRGAVPAVSPAPPDLTDAEGGVEVTPTPTTPDPGTGAGDDWKGAGGE